MAQQVFPQWSPVVKAHNEDQQEVYIPAAIIHAQTRDGKDELIVGAANMQKDDVTGLYLPTDKDFPLEVRVRHLEALIGKLDASKETDPDAASATLLALLRGLLATIAAIKGNDGIKKIADAVTVDGLNALATESTLGEVKSALAALGATSDAAETDPAETASQIALLKGLLTRLNTVAGTVDNGAAKVTLTGHFAEFEVSSLVTVEPGTTVTLISSLPISGFAMLEFAGSGDGLAVDPNVNFQYVVSKSATNFSYWDRLKPTTVMSVSTHTPTGTFWSSQPVPIIGRYLRFQIRNTHASSTYNLRGLYVRLTW